MKYGKYIATLAATCVFLTGCNTTAPMYLNLQPGVATKLSAGYAHPTVVVLDRRPDSAVDQGQIDNNRSVTIRHPVRWLKRSFARLQYKKLSKPVKATVILKKLYIDQNAEDIVGGLVVKVRYQHGKRSLRKLYRGQCDQVDWLGSSGEAKGCFNTALKQVLRQAQKDLTRFTS